MNWFFRDKGRLCPKRLPYHTSHAGPKTKLNQTCPSRPRFTALVEGHPPPWPPSTALRTYLCTYQFTRWVKGTCRYYERRPGQVVPAFLLPLPLQVPRFPIPPSLPSTSLIPLVVAAGLPFPSRLPPHNKSISFIIHDNGKNQPISTTTRRPNAVSFSHASSRRRFLASAFR